MDLQVWKVYLKLNLLLCLSEFDIYLLFILLSLCIVQQCYTNHCRDTWGKWGITGLKESTYAHVDGGLIVYSIVVTHEVDDTGSRSENGKSAFWLNDKVLESSQCPRALLFLTLPCALFGLTNINRTVPSKAVQVSSLAYRSKGAHSPLGVTAHTTSMAWSRKCLSSWFFIASTSVQLTSNYSKLVTPC